MNKKEKITKEEVWLRGEIDRIIYDRIEKAQGAICPCDSCLDFYFDIARESINLFRCGMLRRAQKRLNSKLKLWE